MDGWICTNDRTKAGCYTRLMLTDIYWFDDKHDGLAVLPLGKCIIQYTLELQLCFRISMHVTHHLSNYTISNKKEK